jgi:HSP20 family protein
MRTQSWNPWSMFDQLDSMFATAPAWPAFEVEESEDATLLTADVPGMREDDIEVTVAGPHLIVRGERKRRNAVAHSFERRFWIGESYDADQITGAVADGVLTIKLAKAAKAKPRKIKLAGGLVDKVKGLLAGDKAQAA